MSLVTGDGNPSEDVDFAPSRSTTGEGRNDVSRVHGNGGLGGGRRGVGRRTHGGEPEKASGDRPEADGPTSIAQRRDNDGASEGGFTR